jgi:hypothetical protein
MQNVSSIDIGDCSTTAINQLPKIQDYKIYPNPVRDQLTIETNNIGIETVYTLSDYLGTEYYECKSSADKVTIPMGNLKNTAYLLKISSKNNTPTIVKIIKY